MFILGDWWNYLIPTGYAYIYDTRKISFSGLAEALMPEAKKKGGVLSFGFPFSRAPYIAGFRAGWFKFTLCTQNSYYGEEKPDDPQGFEEAKTVVELLKKRMKSIDSWANNTILLGDFNIFSINDGSFMTIEKENLTMPGLPKGTYANANLDNQFDQIAFLARDANTQIRITNTGTFPFFDHVYRDSDWKTYQPNMTEKI